MESPGEYLKREREHRGVSLLSIQATTRVPMKYLEALEANDYDNLPHGTFTKGFIKNYCKCLGLDEVDAALRFEQFMKERSHGAETSHKERVKSSKKISLPANPRAVAVAAAGVAILIIVIAYFAFSKKTIASSKAPLLCNRENPKLQ
jgi:cytoskeletal protein RodZ